MKASPGCRRSSAEASSDNFDNARDQVSSGHWLSNAYEAILARPVPSPLRGVLVTAIPFETTTEPLTSTTESLTTTNEFAVATLRREYPHIDVYVRAKDVQSGLRLEKAGVKVVVDETLGPALLLAERVMLKKATMSREEVKSQLAKYRKKHGWQTMSYEEFEEQILNIQSPVPPMPPGTTV